MTVELLIGAGLLAIVVILGLTAVGMARGRRAEEAAREAWHDTVARGAQPASLHPAVALDTCIGSGTCVEVCPEKDVLAVIDGKARLVNPTSCIGHGECLRACPVDAIQLVIGTERRGVDIPLVSRDFETNVPGLFIVGELGGMGLIYNATTQALQCVDALKNQSVPKADGVHQLAIVGAGPAGIAATLGAMEAGLDVVTLDQEGLGGSVLHYPRHKIVMTKPVKLPLYGKLHVADVKKERLLELWQDIVAKTGLTVRGGVKVDAVRKGDDDVFTLATGDGDIRAQRVILALGRRGTPRKLGVPGEETDKVTYRLIDPEQYTGARCVVVGGGDAGVEAAIALDAAGATVHLFHRGGALGCKPRNENALGDSAVTVWVNADTREIRPDAVVVAVDGDVRQVPNDYVLVFIGGILPTRFLEAAGVEVRTFKGEAFAPANR